MKLSKQSPHINRNSEIRLLNREINSHFIEVKKSKVRRVAQGALYALFVSPLFDLTQLTNFADDNYIIDWNPDLGLLIINFEKKLEMIVKWLRGSGLIVNETKTEVCFFHRNALQ